MRVHEEARTPEPRVDVGCGLVAVGSRDIDDGHLVRPPLAEERSEVIGERTLVAEGHVAAEGDEGGED
jgi:hypothetical protein